MRHYLLLAALALPVAAAAQDAPRVAWVTPDPKFPLQVHILSADRNHHFHAHHQLEETESYGSGNILGDTAIGFDYTSNCAGGFLHNAQHNEFYEGRWKEQDRQIEMLVVETGYNKPEKCVLKVSLKPAPYTKDNPPPKLVTAHQ